MEIIKEEDFKEEPDKPLPKELEQAKESNLFTKKDIDALTKGLDNPVAYQQERAAKLKLYIDKRMEEELEEFKYVSDFTRKFIVLYHDMLDKIQKSLYGEKSVNINLTKVTMADVGAMLRNVERGDVIEGKGRVVEQDEGTVSEKEQTQGTRWEFVQEKSR